MRLFLIALSVSLGTVAATASSASSIAETSNPSAYTELSQALEYPTTNCGNVVLLVPREGTQFRDTAHVFPPGMQSFFDRAAALHAKWLTSQDCQGAGVADLTPDRGVDSIDVVDSLTSTPNWAGFQQNGHVAQYAQAGWTVPSANLPDTPYGPTAYYSSAWVGIGDGYPSPPASWPLIQAGTNQNIVTSTRATSYNFWYTVYPYHAVTSIPIPVTAGNAVSVVVAWTPSAPGSSDGTAYFGVCNESTARCTLQNSLLFAGTHIPTPQAEWIVEAPLVAGHVAALTNFGSISFHNACYAAAYAPGGTITCVPMSNPQPLQIIATVFQRTQALAFPVGNPGTSFRVDYTSPNNGQ